MLQLQVTPKYLLTIFLKFGAKDFTLERSLFHIFGPKAIFTIPGRLTMFNKHVIIFRISFKVKYVS